MQVQYQLNIDDIVAFSLHYSRTSKNARRRIRRSQALGIIAAIAVALAWPRWGFEVRILYPLGYALFLLFGFPFYYRWSVERHTRKLYAAGQNKGALGNHIISLDSEGVLEISDVGESRTTWSGIEKVEENEAYIFLFTGSLQAHMIPKRAFLSESEATEFFRLAQAYHFEHLAPLIT
jgi:hypothetical protein